MLTEKLLNTVELCISNPLLWSEVLKGKTMLVLMSGFILYIKKLTVKIYCF